MFMSIYCVLLHSADYNTGLLSYFKLSNLFIIGIRYNIVIKSDLVDLFILFRSLFIFSLIFIQLKKGVYSIAWLTFITFPPFFNTMFPSDTIMVIRYFLKVAVLYIYLK